MVTDRRTGSASSCFGLARHATRADPEEGRRPALGASRQGQSQLGLRGDPWLHGPRAVGRRPAGRARRRVRARGHRLRARHRRPPLPRRSARRRPRRDAAQDARFRRRGLAAQMPPGLLSAVTARHAVDPPRRTASPAGAKVLGALRGDLGRSAWWWSARAVAADIDEADAPRCAPVPPAAAARRARGSPARRGRRRGAPAASADRRPRGGRASRRPGDRPGARHGEDRRRHPHRGPHGRRPRSRERGQRAGLHEAAHGLRGAEPARHRPPVPARRVRCHHRGSGRGPPAAGGLPVRRRGRGRSLSAVRPLEQGSRPRRGGPRRSAPAAQGHRVPRRSLVPRARRPRSDGRRRRDRTWYGALCTARRAARSCPRRTSGRPPPAAAGTARYPWGKDEVRCHSRWWCRATGSSACRRRVPRIRLPRARWARRPQDVTPEGVHDLGGNAAEVGGLPVFARRGNRGASGRRGRRPDLPKVVPRRLVPRTVHGPHQRAQQAHPRRAPATTWSFRCAVR